MPLGTALYEQVKLGRTLNGEIVSLSVIETPRAFPTTGAPAAETTVGNSAFNPELTTFLHSTVPMSSTLMYTACQSQPDKFPKG